MTCNDFKRVTIRTFEAVFKILGKEANIVYRYISLQAVPELLLLFLLLLFLPWLLSVESFPLAALFLPVPRQTLSLKLGLRCGKSKMFFVSYF